MHSLESLHTFGLPYRAKQVIPIHQIDEHAQTLHESYQQGCPFIILGEGSNTVFTEDYIGVVWQNHLRGIVFNEQGDHIQIQVASGENWHALVTQCVQRGIGGFENLALIPGTVGAAPIQNIGAYGVEVAQFIESVEYLDLATQQIITLTGAACEFGYRDSIFKHALKDKVFITQVNFLLPKQHTLVTQYGELSALMSPTIQSVYDTVIAIRQAKLPDPAQIGNAGSFFKNPVIDTSLFKQILTHYPDAPHYMVNAEQGLIKIPAAWLIDTIGFKGTMQGGVQCHPQQALVLTNLQDATGQDLIAFAQTIKQAVYAEFNIALEHEVQLMDARQRVTL